MPSEIEARIVELRRLQPGWGPRTIRFRLEAEQVVPLPSRSSTYRCLVRHGLIVPEARRRKKGDYGRWERSRAMELWQMDVVGGVQLVNGWKASIVSGVDDHSRFVISAHVVERATARPVCEALAKAMRAHGVPREILEDNGKVFTGRFGPGTGEVLFDRNTGNGPLYRGRGRAERQICDTKATGLTNLPSHSLAINTAWLAPRAMRPRPARLDAAPRPRRRPRHRGTQTA